MYCWYCMTWFQTGCHAGLGDAWKSIIYSMIQNGECQIPATVGLEKRRYSGALVLEPELKSYTIPIEIFDVKGAISYCNDSS